MKIYIVYLSAIVFSIWLFSSCNSTGYEIEEVEDYSDTSVIVSRNEIKQEVEQPKIEIKSDPAEIKDPENSTNNSGPLLYYVQFGAFMKEENALAYTQKVKDVLKIDVTCKLINGLYKVRTDVFTKKEDAVQLLSKVRESGFECFIPSSTK